MSQWKKVKLSELGEIVGGATPSTKREDYYNGDIPWLTPKDLAGYNGRYIARGERNITKEGLSSCSAKLMPKHSILFTSRAPIGYIAIAENEICTNQGFKSIVPNEYTDYKFLYYLLRYNKEKIEAMGSGTTFKEVSGTVMRNIEIVVPIDIKEQKTIADILSALDDKIELNNRINSNLEQQLSTIFDKYSSEQIVNVPFSAICTLTSSKRVFAKEYTKTGIPFYRGKEISILSKGNKIDNYLYISKEHYEQLKSQYGVPLPGDILITAVGTIGNSYMVQDNKFYFKDGNIIWLKDFKIPRINYYVYDYMQSSNFKQLLESSIIGSTQEALTIISLSKIDIPVPKDDSRLQEYFEISSSLHSQITANVKENHVLTMVRDNLLPKLMSGKIRVPLEV